MRLTERIDITAVSVVGFGCSPRKGRKAGGPKKTSKRKAKNLIAADKTGKVALRLQTPLTRTLAELLGVDHLLFEEQRNVPRDGYKRIVLDVDGFLNVHVHVQNREPDAMLDIVADRLERWIVVDQKGNGPMLQWDVRSSGYISQLADFVAIIDNNLFVTTWSPAQAALQFEAPSNKGQLPEVYRAQ